VEIDIARIEKYLGEIATETIDVNKVLEMSNAEIVKDPHVLKSLKYSTIVIAEAVASTLQHILAKKHNVVVGGYMDVFVKSVSYSLLTEDLLERLRPFIVFRNMLVHQYWRVTDEVFLNNMREGVKDFTEFSVLIKKML
jgi:uncharacterized protein YutE (UPF0331/DUF86 family)